jgi:hypothetical protein
MTVVEFDLGIPKRKLTEAQKDLLDSSKNISGIYDNAMEDDQEKALGD